MEQYQQQQQQQFVAIDPSMLVLQTTPDGQQQWVLNTAALAGSGQSGSAPNMLPQPAPVQSSGSNNGDIAPVQTWSGDPRSGQRPPPIQTGVSAYTPKREEDDKVQELAQSPRLPATGSDPTNNNRSRAVSSILQSPPPPPPPAMPSPQPSIQNKRWPVISASGGGSVGSVEPGHQSPANLNELVSNLRKNEDQLRRSNSARKPGAHTPLSFREELIQRQQSLSKAGGLNAQTAYSNQTSPSTKPSSLRVGAAQIPQQQQQLDDLSRMIGELKDYTGEDTTLMVKPQSTDNTGHVNHTAAAAPVTLFPPSPKSLQFHGMVSPQMTAPESVPSSPLRSYDENNPMRGVAPPPRSPLLLPSDAAVDDLLASPVADDIDKLAADMEQMVREMQKASIPHSP
jgi:hypothetical protein